MKKLSFFLFLAFFAPQVKAQITTATPFLLISSDARAGGMGDVGVATSADAFSIFHNPAKTAFNKNKINIGLNYTPWLRNLTDDIFVGNISYVNRFQENAAFGVDLKYFSLGQIDLNEVKVGGGIRDLGYKNPNEFSITGIYSMKLSEKFSMGVGLKYINSNLDVNDNNTGAVSAFAVDISGFYQSEERNYGNFNGRYRLGFNIANIGPKVAYTPGEEYFIPTNAKFGGGFDFILNSENTVGLNLEFTKLLVPSSSAASSRGWIEGMFTSLGDRDFSEELQETTWALGTEYIYNNAFALRAGYFHESKEKGQRQFLSLGTGFTAKAFTLDLSYLVNTSQVNNPLENTLRFSLSFDLGEIYDNL
ncbi:type IX secretion system outer membrane channel protein PorV [Tenacibaculum dicentrarchi]|uniref:type IX secretion system outer membrane channel protein PorV n=1 Tax=Tenacibaculum dicentrarchi TaxID=669041 RepID=UPI000C79BBA2|nr:type IX secretion system outer membrane channel protein PorV [Tenacibaculum dicentrarchi]MCD8415819.1 type IX secretion system outer membrane channel protein PorV [Tenacibaculum dicentrarchi]MCD8420943.1 type IX secretion system outer membrane channel protein PorV [Tenacibaculum dicentrarchi]MCD8425807.1 type IX secretion system outer membrane channel protein PorV [Tenacibaculum dicentrarchi]MCD8435727.1 type IX secretion system outer membrane channel protein PorV [Tenacibaculum dicentrarchi